MFRPTLFESFFQAGFECSTFKRNEGTRIDPLGASGHDRMAEADYRLVSRLGLRTIRDGVRWHLVEASPGQRDWSSVRPMLKAANAAEVQVIWDICHFGWPDDLDVWTPRFVERFADFARSFAQLVQEETDRIPFYCPVNEMSYLAWAGGEAAYFHPSASGRAAELKMQLARASIAAMNAIRSVDPRARFVHADPVINIICDPARPADRDCAERFNAAQFEAWDLISGRMAPEIGGAPAFLDIIGVNYYAYNQWIFGGRPIKAEHPLYKPFRDLLIERHARYGRPIFVAETSVDGEGRPAWLRYICCEVTAAIQAGVPVEGICLYPIMNHSEWFNNARVCSSGLLDISEEDGERMIHRPLAAELARQQEFFAAFFSGAPVDAELVCDPPIIRGDHEAPKPPHLT